MSAVVGGVPCLIREVFYAPECPQSVAKLFEVALVRHNNGDLEDAINTYLAGQAEWEHCILQECYNDLEDPTSSSMLQTLMRREKELHDEAQAVLDAQLVEKATHDVALADHLEREAEALAAAAARAAELADADATPSPLFKQKEAVNGSGERVAAAAAGSGEATHLYTKSDLKKFQDEQRRRQEIRAAELEKEAAKHRERHERKMLAMYECPQRLPIEGHIYVQLAVGSVLETSGDDERALASYLYAMELAETRLGAGNPARHPVTATVHSCLACVYFHLAQYDFAADHYFKALEIREQLLPAGHVDIAATLNNIACVLHMLRRTNDALVFYYRAADIFTDQLNPTHPRIDAVERNIRRAKQSSMQGVVPPPVPFQAGVRPPIIPGVRRAKEMLQPKAKKPKAKK